MDEQGVQLPTPEIQEVRGVNSHTHTQPQYQWGLVCSEKDSLRYCKNHHYNYRSDLLKYEW